jgi:parvulin-like peptidyl-prolyl isomerase
MKKKLRIVLLLIIAMLCSCGRSADTGSDYASTREGRRVILEIEGKEYTNADFRRYLNVTTGQEFTSIAPEAQQELVLSFLEEKLLLEAAEDASVTLSDEESRKYLQGVLGENAVLETAEADTAVKPFLDKYLVEKFTAGLIQGIEVNSDEIEQYYEEHKRDFLRPERVRVSQILLGSEEQAVAALERVKGRSEDVFRETAQNMSIGMEAPLGGEMGIFAMGQLPVEMDNVIFQLKKNEVSQIAESAYGYHIFRLDEKLEQTLMTLEEANSEIRKRLLNREIGRFMEDYLKKLKERYDWTFYSDRLAKPEIGEIP